MVKLKALQSRFDLLDPAKLAPTSAGDFELLKSTIKSRLLELDTIRMWRKDPDLYTSGVTRSIYLIIERNFAPPHVRLRSVIALEQMPGMIDFFRMDVPGAFAEVKDAQLVAEFQRSNVAVIDALRKYQIFLRDDLLPISEGDFRIGAENYRKKLLADEMVDIPFKNSRGRANRNSRRTSTAAEVHGKGPVPRRFDGGQLPPQLAF